MNITIYSKKNCCLCDSAKRAVNEVLKEITLKDPAKDHVKNHVSILEVDIEENRELFDIYKYLIPVVEINGKTTFIYRVDKEELWKLLKSKYP